MSLIEAVSKLRGCKGTEVKIFIARKRYTPEQIIRLLCQADVLSSQGRNLSEICREIGVIENTHYRWRKEYGGMRVNQAKRLKELERENSRLKRAAFSGA